MDPQKKQSVTKLTEYLKFLDVALEKNPNYMAHHYRKTQTLMSLFEITREISDANNALASYQKAIEIAKSSEQKVQEALFLSGRSVAYAKFLRNELAAEDIISTIGTFDIVHPFVKPLFSNDRFF